jgi:hypothetical protein
VQKIEENIISNTVFYMNLETTIPIYRPRKITQWSERGWKIGSEE